MPSQHLLNDAHHCVLEAIEGLCLERHNTIRHLGDRGTPNVIALREHLISKTSTAVICGGGSGHEPMHGGFVAPGMLSAAVCGRVFASPPISHVRAAIDYLLSNGAPSVLVLVKRYTGDIINFGAAVEAAKQTYGQGSVAMSVIGDDVTFGGDDEEARGIAGTVLWYRLVTAAAARLGAVATADYPPSVATLKQFSDVACTAIRSMGASLQSCTLPGADGPNATIPAGVIEIGLGIHGERGSKSIAFGGGDAYGGIDAIVKHIVFQLLTPPAKQRGDEGGNAEQKTSKDACGVLGLMAKGRGSSWVMRNPCEEGDDAIVGGDLLIYANNLGGTTNLEMSVILRAALRAIYRDELTQVVRDQAASAKNKNGGGNGGGQLSVAICGSGAICTSLNMHGFSLTAVNLTRLSRSLFKAFCCSEEETTPQGKREAAVLASFNSPQTLKEMLLSATEGASGLGLFAGPTAEEAAGIFIDKESSSSSSAVVGGVSKLVSAPTPSAVDASLSPMVCRLKGILSAAVQTLVDKAAKYNSLDAACGDGDTGTGIAAAGNALLMDGAPLLGQLAAALAEAKTQQQQQQSSAALPAALVAVGNTICDAMAGSMGALLSIFVSAMGNYILDALPISYDTVPIFVAMLADPRVLAAGLKAGADAVRRVIGTVEGDRTFIDITSSVAERLLASSSSSSSPVSRVEVAAAVTEAAEAVSQMRAKKGRARYLGGLEVGTRDPGAEIVADFILSVISSL